jgi:hypothetical protein
VFAAFAKIGSAGIHSSFRWFGLAVAGGVLLGEDDVTREEYYRFEQGGHVLVE